MSKFQRDYAPLIAAAAKRADREAAMRSVVNSLWDAFRAEGFSWVGFYVDHPGQPDDRRLLLGPHRDRPACSPIELHGVCGAALLKAEPIIVDDVTALGASYIACDPRDRSEIVIPLLNGEGLCWGVLDVDSEHVAAFDSRDEAGLLQLLRAAGL